MGENSEYEITSVVKERLDSHGEHGPTDLQREFKKTHLRAAHELSETLRFDSDELENCNHWFHFAPRLLTWRGEVSAGFLEKNWVKSSKNPD